MQKTAGILLFRKSGKETEYFLVHPGGPFWKNKDNGAWSVPKGEFGDDEGPLSAARREFEEETGIAIDGKFIGLKPVKQKSGKTVYAFGCEGDIDHNLIRSNTIMIEWPPRTGRQIEIPEVDRGGWFTFDIAKEKILPGQLPILQELHELLQK